MIVVDTNVIAYLFLPGERSAAAEAVLRRDPDWAAPWLWRSELSNILATYVRNDGLSVDDALAIQAAALDRMHGREYEVAPARALLAATESGCSSYDAEFAALAVDLGVPLVTSDRRVARGFPDVAVRLETFAADSR